MKLFVAKLPQHITSERLKAMFEAYGQVVDAKIIMDRETNKSKCYGFVEMSDSSGGNAAIEHLNGTQMEGKEILVKESDPAPPRSDQGGGNRSSGGFRPSFNSGGNDRRPGGQGGGGPRPDRWNNDRPKSDRYNSNDNDRNKRRYDDDFDDKPRRKRI